MFQRVILGTTTDGYVHVTGRIKEQYKLENGKYTCASPHRRGHRHEYASISQVASAVPTVPTMWPCFVPDWTAVRIHLGLSSRKTKNKLVVITATTFVNICWIENSCAAGNSKFGSVTLGRRHPYGREQYVDAQDEM